MMKTQMWMKVVLLVVLATVALVPARPGEASVEHVLEAIKTAYTLYEQFQGQEITLAQATTDIITAVHAAKAEILSHIDAIAAAHARACAEALLINYESIDQLTLDNQQRLALDAINCLAEIEVLLNEAAFEDQAAVDTLGFALNPLGPVALLVHAHAHLDLAAPTLDLVASGNEAVIGKIVPHCFRQTLWGDDTSGHPEIQIRCTAYNGDTGFGVSYVGDPHLEAEAQAAERAAYRNTSRRVAESVDVAL
jgi:hypothetical protein